MTLPATVLVALLILLAPARSSAVTISGDFAFSENRGPNPYISSGFKFVLGATNVSPSGSPTTVSATHVPGSGSGSDYPALSFLPSPLSPNQYGVVEPYTGQTGRWDITATRPGDTPSSAVKRTHTLDDPQLLPLTTGLTAAGDPLTPHLSWDAVNSTAFPSIRFYGVDCCALGTDFYQLQIEVRLVTLTPGNPAPQVFTSAQLSTTATMFDMPNGILAPGNTYMLGVRLNQFEIEQCLNEGCTSYSTFLESRATSYLVASTVSEPGSLALFALGIAAWGALAGGRRAGRSTR